MKKAVIFILAMAISSPALANWYCVATSPSGGWGAWTSQYQHVSRNNAMQACRENTPYYSYCTIQQCIWTGYNQRYYW